MFRRCGSALKSKISTYPTTRRIMRWILAAFYGAAAIAHLFVPQQLLAITPSWVPFAPQVILVTGVFEMLASVAILTSRLRAVAGILMAIYAICVWPANFKHAIDGINIPYISSSWWYHAPRLAFQPVIVWWALFCSGVIDWPVRRGQSRVGPAEDT